MNLPPPLLLGRACRIFMDLAYPEGKDTIPARKLPYFEMEQHDLAQLLPPAERAAGVVREVKDQQGEAVALEFRLGSAHFPHLKMRVQEVQNHPGTPWIFMVDTHDHVPRMDLGADEDAFRQLQQANRQLKERIETALEQEGLMTPNMLLRADLT